MFTFFSLAYLSLKCLLALSQPDLTCSGLLVVPDSLLLAKVRVFLTYSEDLREWEAKREGRDGASRE